MRRAGRDRHVGYHEHVEPLVEQDADRIGRAGPRHAQIGVGPERARNVVVRREQGLCDIRARAADETDAAALPALVEQRDRAG